MKEDEGTTATRIPFNSRRASVMYGLYCGPIAGLGVLVEDVNMLLSHAPFFDRTCIMKYTPNGEMRPLWQWSDNMWVAYKS